MTRIEIVTALVAAKVAANSSAYIGSAAVIVAGELADIILKLDEQHTDSQPPRELMGG